MPTRFFLFVKNQTRIATTGFDPVTSGFLMIIINAYMGPAQFLYATSLPPHHTTLEGFEPSRP